MKKVAVYGSCISRDNFNSKFNPDYKEDFEVGLFQNQTSILSMMSEPTDIVNGDIDLLKTDHEKWTLRTESQKDFIIKNHKNDFDYLIIDFFSDVYFGSIKLGNEQYFTNNTKYLFLPSLKNKERFNPYNSFEEYYSIWKNKANSFFEKINKIFPNTKIIIVKSYFLNEFKDGTLLNENRKRSKIPTFDTGRLNDIYNKMFDYVEKNFGYDYIDMTDKQYYLNKNHPWKEFYVHYEFDYYHDFIKKLREINKNAD